MKKSNSLIGMDAASANGILSSLSKLSGQETNHDGIGANEGDAAPSPHLAPPRSASKKAADVSHDGRSPSPLTITEQLRQAIAAASRVGMTRYQLSKRSGVSEGNLSRFMNRKQYLDLSSVDKLAHTLGLSLVVNGFQPGGPSTDKQEKAQEAEALEPLQTTTRE